MDTDLDPGLLRKVGLSLLAPLDAGARAPLERLLMAGGKLVRPRLFWSAARTLKDYRLAAAIELVHLSSLLHDDVVDRADKRRGLAVPPSALAASSGVGGIGVAAQTFAGYPAAFGTDLSYTLTRMAEGQLLDASRGFDLDIKIDKLEQIFRMKTGALFSLASRTGARLSDSSRYCSAYGRSGEDFGVAFQILDDALMVLRSDLGKSREQDTRIGVPSYPLVLLAESGQRARDVVEERLWSTSEAESGELELQEHLEHAEVIRRSLERADTLVSHAVRRVTPSEYTDAMLEIYGGLRGAFD